MQRKPPRRVKRTASGYFLALSANNAAASRGNDFAHFVVAFLLFLAVFFALYGTFSYTEAHAQVSTPRGAIPAQPGERVLGQALPEVSLVSLDPSPVREGQSLQITVRIDPTITEQNKVIRSGVRVFEPELGGVQLIGVAFRSGQATRI